NDETSGETNQRRRASNLQVPRWALGTVGNPESRATHGQMSLDREATRWWHSGDAMTNARWTCAVGVLILGVWSTQHAVATADAFSADTPPVVVAELFTSEGCSSCPPADQVLSQLVKRGQPGVEVLALGEHVDYWDRLGWRDPFSSSANSSRQAQYDARVFHRNEVYTPQLVIDGKLAAVGSD